MLFIETACPFCFSIGRHKAVAITDNKRSEPETIAITVRCFSCDKFFLAVSKKPINSNEFNNIRSFFANIRTEEIFKGDNFTIFPKPEFFIHPSFPDKVKKLIKELFRTKEPSVAVMHGRVILEYVLKDIGIGTEKDNLYNRIQKAYEEGIITKPVADWAHIVRKFGNVAIHEVEATQAEAEEVKEFIKIFLDLVYRIPYEIQKFAK